MYVFYCYIAMRASEIKYFYITQISKWFSDDDDDVSIIEYKRHVHGVFMFMVLVGIIECNWLKELNNYR
jgi:hypothetical protein